MTDYEIPLEKLKKAGINPQIGGRLILTLKDGTKTPAKITKIGKGTVIVTSK